MQTVDNVFDIYQNSEQYNQHALEIDFSWLNDKLNQEEIANVESYAANLVLDNEKEVFTQGFQMAWALFHDLSKGK